MKNGINATHKFFTTTNSLQQLSKAGMIALAITFNSFNSCFSQEMQGEYLSTGGAASSSSGAPPSSARTTDDTNFALQDASALTQEKLNNPKKVLTMDQSLQVITHCLHIGEERAGKAKGKDVVIFIGNTGAGKSTTVNYLHGCELEKIRKRDLNLAGSGKVIRVKDSSATKELMPIGHEIVSKTFLPDIASDEHFTYCDCPGFLDNRGSEINIANAVNIKTAIAAAKSVKVFLLINYKSLEVDRGRGINEVRKILKDLFGDEASLQANFKDILVGITKVPLDGDDKVDNMT